MKSVGEIIAEAGGVDAFLGKDGFGIKIGDGEFSLTDYWIAPNGEGPIAAQWADKPHRLVYDLCRHIVGQGELLRKTAGALKDEAEKIDRLSTNNDAWWLETSMETDDILAILKAEGWVE